MQYRKLPIALLEKDYTEHIIKRSIRKDAVDTLAESMGKIGLIIPIAVKPAKIIRTGAKVDGWIVLSGHHRREAAIKLGWKEVDCVIYEGEEIDSRAAIIAENLHRAELTYDELVIFRSYWAEAIMGRKAEEVSAHDVQKLPPKGHPHTSTGVGRGKGGGRPKGGERGAAREMGIPQTTVRRARKAAATSSGSSDTTTKQKVPRTNRQQRLANERARKAESKSCSNAVEENWSAALRALRSINDQVSVDTLFAEPITTFDDGAFGAALDAAFAWITALHERFKSPAMNGGDA